ncbi:MAG: glycoside hydrolase family 65 protein [Eubacteriales bacterium]|nr:glycoside hydrolase family 65 protein [Eubacteriales bacterium]
MKELMITTSSCAREEIPDLGNRYLTGNGYMGVRGTLEEYGRDQLVAVNLAGIYDRFGTGWREPLNAPNPFALRFLSGGEPLTLPEAAADAHRQTLDVRRALHSRETRFENGVCLHIERFSHMEQVHLLCLQATVTAQSAATFTLEAAIDGDVWDIHGPHYREMALDTQDELLTALGTTNEGDQVAVCAGYTLDLAHTRRDRTDARKRIAAFAFQLRAGETATFTLTAAVYTSRDTQSPADAARRAAQAAPAYATLRTQHIRCWEKLWERANIEIDGDETAEQALNYSAYHLLSVAPRHAESLSVPARGLSGQTYKGAIFWDTEMFMLDFYLAILPEVAKATLRYRIDTLPGARVKAEQYGLRGAFYAWESQEGGYDACSDYNVTDVFTQRPMRTYFRDKQIHITAAVVYGLWKYARWTGDDSLWREGGAEVLVEAARFYHSLLVRRVESDIDELRDVIGPDEYHERVNNNAYTNEMARFVFEQSVEVTTRMARQAPDDFEALERKLRFKTEIPRFTEAACSLKRQAPDAKGVMEQFDGYFALEDATVAQVRARLIDPREYWGGAYGVAAQTQVIKQADVITLLFMLRDRYTADTLRANYEYYLPRTEHGSSLSACMYALAACAIGKPDEAYPLFLGSAQADLNGGGKQWAGLVYIGGTHPAAAGGAYMALLWGFLGIQPDADGIRISPRLPKGWQGVACQVVYRGQVVQLACGTLADGHQGTAF